jgi:TonB-dependent starch-binding outer membrane protein SusC
MYLFTKKLLRISFLLLLAGMSFLANAQRTISGVVKDSETGETLIGVTVLEKETQTNGAISDFDGNFKIKVGKGATGLIFRYTGYEVFEQSIVSMPDALEINMKPNAILKEVLVIGYGTVKREDATGLVQSVGTDKFNKGAVTSTQDLLAGKIAGVVVTAGDGSPGGGAKIRIRGESSLSANSDPLIVVDGVPLDNGGISGSRNPLSIVNPNDIETITVLKDASAAAIYGNRASGGVIIITTKKGALGKKIRVNYNTNFSVGETYNRVDVLDADEFRAAVLAKHGPFDPTKPVSVKQPAGLLGNANTDWQDEIYRKSTGTDHSLSLSGGIGIVPYRVSVGYTNQNGLLKTDNYQRYSTAVNLSPKFFNNTLQVNVNVKGILSKNHFADRGAIGSALSFDPTRTVKQDTTGAPFDGYTTWTQRNRIITFDTTVVNGQQMISSDTIFKQEPNGLAPTNPAALLALTDDNSTVQHYIINTTIDYRFPFLPALRANLNIAYDRSFGSGTKVIPNFASFAYDNISGGGVNNYYEQTKQNSLLESYLNYKKEFGKHEIDLMGGYSWQRFDYQSSSLNNDAAGTRSERKETSDPSQLYLVSLFTRINYSFADRYLLTGSLRRDGTSRFDPRFRYGLFPAAAFAVKILDNNNKYFNSLKLRTSYGHTGQQDIGDGRNRYAYLPIYQGSDSTAQYQFGSDYYLTTRPNAYVANIKWEETDSYNAGLDFSLVKERINGSFDVYQRNTQDLLNYIPVPALSNLTNFVTKNIGTMETKGVELSLNFVPIVREKLKWEFSTNFAINRSKITKLTTSEDPDYIGVLTGGIAGGVGSNIQIHSVGYAPYSFYVNQQLYDETGKILEGQFANLNGDTLVNDKDKYRFKNPAPLYTIGLTNNITAGNFDFSFAGRLNVGNYVYNNVQTDQGYLNRLFGTTGYLSNVNQSAVDLNVQDQAKLTFSDHFVTEASFFKLDHVTAGYTLQKVKGATIRFSATVQNVLVLTRYKGLDPEIGNGIDNNLYPRPRTFVMGLNVSF